MVLEIWNEILLWRLSAFNKENFEKKPAYFLVY